MEKVDIVCPLYYIPSNFEEYVNSWAKAIPINTIWFGLGQDLDEKFILNMNRNVNLALIDQRDYKTLGYCLQELFTLVETDWFVYFHSDVKVENDWFKQMWEYKVRGITESLKDPTNFGAIVGTQARRRRAYSGAQLFYTEAIQDIDIQDDYVYTSEDWVFKHHIESKGYQYRKVPIYHQHFPMNQRSTERVKQMIMQTQALIKYCSPTDDIVKAVRVALWVLYHRHSQEFDVESFIHENNLSWIDIDLEFEK